MPRILPQQKQGELSPDRAAATSADDSVLFSQEFQPPGLAPKTALATMLGQTERPGLGGALPEQLWNKFVRDCVECFMFHDVDDDGLVPVEELPWMLRNLGQFWTEEELCALVADFRFRAISHLDVNQFIDLNAREHDQRQLDVSRVVDAFGVMDRLNNGSVPLEDLKRYVKCFRERLTEDDWQLLMKISVDVKDGYKPVALKQKAFLKMFAGSVDEFL
ncbi:ef hand domain-containing protein [Cystoisospora suis]|uniref:Calmodulin n=1 Tax=Cystoisospora suis TaxID=483139 RepID=A0A2C6KZX9_9APIC|nr:ef hand domain-containing protein [Cystoisospora suis]